MEGANGLGYLSNASRPEKESLSLDTFSTPTFSPYTAPLGADSHKPLLHLPGQGQGLHILLPQAAHSPSLAGGLGKPKAENTWPITSDKSATPQMSQTTGMQTSAHFLLSV